MKVFSCVLVTAVLVVVWSARVSAEERPPEQKKALAELRSVLAGRLVTEIDDKLATAKALKGTAEYEQELMRLQLLADYVRGFWDAVDKGAQAALKAGEFMVDGNPVAVVEYDRRMLIIRHEGENKRYTRETIPAKLAWVVAQQHLKPDVAANKVYFGAFLAMDAKGDRKLARQQWDEAAKGGRSVEFLLPELAVPRSPAPALPALLPQQQALLAPAQWQLQTKDGKRIERDALGKEARQTDEGRLVMGALEAEEQSLIYKTRLAGDFQCRIFLKDVWAGQSFGLFAATSAEPNVLVPLPEGTVKVELVRRRGVYFCRINDEDVELKELDKSAARLSGYLGVTLLSGRALTVASFELGTR